MCLKASVAVEGPLVWIGENVLFHGQWMQLPVVTQGFLSKMFEACEGKGQKSFEPNMTKFCKRNGIAHFS
jgi:hypothetical protein